MQGQYPQEATADERLLAEEGFAPHASPASQPDAAGLYDPAESFTPHPQTAAPDPRQAAPAPEMAPHAAAQGPSADFVALIHAIAAEGLARRMETRRQDRQRKLRDWIILALLALTLGAIGWQAREMIGLYGRIKADAAASGRTADAAQRSADAAQRSADAATQQAATVAKALTDAQRAWIGPRNVSLTSEPQVGKPLGITVAYENSGRQPAADFRWSVEPFAVPAAEETTGVSKIRAYMQACSTTNTWPGGTMVYPGGAGYGGGYTFTSTTKDDLVTPGVTKGDDIIVVQGCLLYHTFDQPKHSYFCYFYRKGASRISSLDVCTAGDHAD